MTKSVLVAIAGYLCLMVAYDAFSHEWDAVRRGKSGYTTPYLPTQAETCTDWCANAPGDNAPCSYDSSPPTVGCRDKNNHLMSGFDIDYIHCDHDKYWDVNAQECLTPPTCDPPNEINPVTGDCEEPCESQSWYDGVVYNNEYGLAHGDCLPTPEECSLNNQGAVIDPSVSQTSIGADSSVACIGPGGECTNVTGKSQVSDLDFCQEIADECTSIGGTYGAIGINDGQDATHVCLVDYADTLPTCASGSQYWADPDGQGGYAFACTPATPPNDVCDATKYDCDGDGNVDDQDGDGVLDNGVENEHDDGGGGDGEEQNVGEDELDPATEGAGDCDPTSTNYAECTGAAVDTDLLEDAIGAITAELGPPAELADGEKDIATSSNDFYTAMQTVPIVSAVGSFASGVTGSSTCPAPSFDVFGVTFDLDFHCTLYPTIAGTLSLVALVMWTLLGIRIVMSA